MGEIETTLAQVLLELAHHPYLLMIGIVLILFASSFGLPLPEEIVLITSGMIASTSMEEAQRLGTSPTVDPWFLSFVCFIAVLGSDLLVFALGRHYGQSILKKKPFNRFLSEQSLMKVQEWTARFGPLACCVFRFTPGIRFPGHFMCGALKISYRNFLLTDGLAALLTVPTQVLLIAFYGSEVLHFAKQFKIGLLATLLVAGCIWLFFKVKSKSSKARSENSSDSAA